MSTELEVLISNPLGAEADGQRRRSEEEMPSDMVRFGPTYGEDTEVILRVKDSAWQHIMRETSGESKTSYLHSIGAIEEEAMRSYDSSKFRRSKFRLMMARDGCFFLQLALHILGGGDHLGYPDRHPHFGKDSNSSFWIPDMFFVGNQIPYAVIDALMTQPFFKAVIKKGTEKGTWGRPIEDPVRLALYQTVVEPQLSKKRHRGEPPSDILSALRSVLLGSGHDDYPSYYQMTGFRDFEADGSKEEERKEDKFPSAGKLSNSGIKLRKTNKGINGIHFKNLGLFSYLYLPTFIIFDGHAEQILTSLISYELMMNERERKVASYIRLIRDLIPTYRDFKILETTGIIRVEDINLKSNMGRMLDNLVSLHDPNFTPNIREIRQKIRDYEIVPWRQISFACSIACGIVTFLIAVLTIVQTVFTVLSYYHSRSN